MQLNGPTPGTGYSQLNVTGAVDLAECSLNASLGFTPTSAEQFTIIKSTAPIEGTFDGLPEGASLTIGNMPFTISYHGGNGDDVVLTQAVATTPMVTGISPSSGPATGGTSVTITGTGFTGATVVDFGTTPATDVTVVNNTTITANCPAGNGVANVTVTTPTGTSAISDADQFTYIAAPPTVKSVSRFGYHMHPTSLVIQFDGPLDAESTRMSRAIRSSVLVGTKSPSPRSFITQIRWQSHSRPQPG